MRTKPTESSLQRYDSLHDRLRLHFQASKHAVIVVEGQADRELLSSLLPARHIFVAGTRKLVIDTGENLHNTHHCSVACVFDLDFDEDPRATSPAAAHLYPYDGRDLEAMLIEQGALETLIKFKGSAAKLESIGGAAALVARALAEVQPVTALRNWSRGRGIGCRFRPGLIRDKMNRRALTLERDRYFAAIVADYDGVQTLTKSELSKAAEGPVLQARGKDVLEVVAVALRSVAATLPEAACDPELLTIDLHAVSRLELQGSSWFSGLVALLERADVGQLT